MRRARSSHGGVPQLELEGRTRAELEDVLQRIERHLRSEQTVRRRAEESEREAAEELAHERELRVRLEEEVRLLCPHGCVRVRAPALGALTALLRVGPAAAPPLRGNQGDRCAARISRGRACHRG